MAATRLRKMNPEKRQRVLATVERMERLAARADGIMDQVYGELVQAVSKYPTFASGHEGWAVIREELDELWDEVRKRNPDRFCMRTEAVQVAAMAVRFILDLCD